jgi:hypothetical protein
MMSRLPVAFRRTGIRLLGILFPPGTWASLTVGLPARSQAVRTRTGFPHIAHVRPGWGWAPSISRG